MFGVVCLVPCHTLCCILHTIWWSVDSYTELRIDIHCWTTSIYNITFLTNWTCAIWSLKAWQHIVTIPIVLVCVYPTSYCMFMLYCLTWNTLAVMTVYECVSYFICTWVYLILLLHLAGTILQHSITSHLVVVVVYLGCSYTLLSHMTHPVMVKHTMQHIFTCNLSCLHWSMCSSLIIQCVWFTLSCQLFHVCCKLPIQITPHSVHIMYHTMCSHDNHYQTHKT
jgi:hypothetical protein